MAATTTKRTTQAKKTTENKAVAVKKAPFIEKDEKIEKTIQIGDYKILVQGDATKAIAKVIARDTDIVLEKEFEPVQIAVIGNTRELGAVDEAQLAAIAAYHEAVSTTDGLVDIEALIEHPLNAIVYGENESVDDLVDLLQKEDGQIFKMSINEKGQVLSGNRRLKAGKIVNQRCIDEGKPPKFEFVPVEVLRLASPEAELKYMILHNQARSKTKTQLARETKNLIALAHSSAIPVEQRLASSEMIAKLRENLGNGGEKASRFTAFNVQKTYKAIEDYQDEKLKEEIQEFAVTVPNKAKELVEAAPPKTAEIDKETYQAKVLERLKTNPTESVKRATQAVNQELISAKAKDGIASGESDHDIEKIIEAAKDAGDIASDNRKTPREIIELAFDAMGSIDLDSFAMATDPEYIGAASQYTIFEDAFKQQHKGNVFANPPFSKAAKAIALLDGEIRQGNIKKLFLVLPVSVQSGKDYQRMIKDHNPMILQPNKRLNFEAGDLLVKEQPESRTDSNREPSMILFWSLDEVDYNNFHDSAINHGAVLRQYAPFNPFQLPGIFASLQWNNDLSCNIFGVHVQILPVEGGFAVKVNNEIEDAVCPTEEMAKRIAIMEAIASLAPATPF